MADKKVTLRGDARSLITSLTNARTAMEKFKAEAADTAKALAAFDKVKVSSNNTKALESLGRAFTKVASGLDAIKKTDIGAIASRIEQISNIKLDGAIGDRIDKIAGALDNLSSSITSAESRRGAATGGGTLPDGAPADLNVEQQAALAKRLNSDLSTGKVLVSDVAEEYLNVVKNVDLVIQTNKQVTDELHNQNAATLSANEQVKQLTQELLTGKRTVDSLTAAEREFLGGATKAKLEVQELFKSFTVRPLDQLIQDIKNGTVNFESLNSVTQKTIRNMFQAEEAGKRVSASLRLTEAERFEQGIRDIVTAIGNGTQKFDDLDAQTQKAVQSSIRLGQEGQKAISNLKLTDDQLETQKLKELVTDISAGTIKFEELDRATQKTVQSFVRAQEEGRKISENLRLTDAERADKDIQDLVASIRSGRKPLEDLSAESLEAARNFIQMEEKGKEAVQTLKGADAKELRADLLAGKKLVEELTDAEIARLTVNNAIVASNKRQLEAMDKVVKKAESAASEAKILEQELNSGERAAADLSERERELLDTQRKIVSENKEYLDSLGKAARLQETNVQKAQRLVKELNAGERAVEDITDEERELIRTTQRVVTENKKFLNTLNGVQNTSNRIDVTWKAIARYWIVGTVIGQARAFQQQIREAVEQAAELSVKLAEVQTIAGEGISDSTISQQIRELSDTFTGDIKDQAEAFYQALSNGVVEAAEAQRFLTDSNKLALASVASVTDATNLLASVINSYSLSTEEATRISDVFFKAVEVGRFRISEIANTIGRTTVVASQLGVSYEDVASGLAFITKQGTTAANAQTLLRNILLKLVKPTDDMKQLLAEFGFESGKALLEAKGLGGSLQFLFEATRGSEGEIAKLFNSIRALQGALAFKGGQAAFEKLRSEITDSAGAAETAAARIQDSIGKQFKLALEQITNVLVQDFGGPILEALADADGSFTTFVDTVKDTLATLLPFAEFFAGFIKLIAPFTQEVLFAVTALIAFKSAGAVVSLGNVAFKGTLSAAVGSLFTMVGSLTKASKAQTFYNTTVLKNIALLRGQQAQLAATAAVQAGVAGTTAGAGAAAVTAAGAFTALGTALKGIVSFGIIGVGVFALTKALEFVTSKSKDATKAIDAFNKKQKDLRLEADKSAKKIIEQAEASDTLLQKLLRFRADRASESIKKFNAELEKTGDGLTNVRKKQAAFEKVFGAPIDAVISGAKKDIKDIQTIVDEINGLLGKGEGDNQLIKDTERQLELLEIQNKSSLDSFDELDNIAQRFNIVEKAIADATEASTITKLIGELESLSNEEFSNSLKSNEEATADLLLRQRQINALEDKRLKQLLKINQAKKASVDSSRLELNNVGVFVKEQEKILEGFLKTDEGFTEALANVQKFELPFIGVQLEFSDESARQADKALSDIVTKLENIIKSDSSLQPILQKSLDKYKEQRDVLDQQKQASAESLSDSQKQIRELQKLRQLKIDIAKASKEEQDAINKVLETTGRLLALGRPSGAEDASALLTGGSFSRSKVFGSKGDEAFNKAIADTVKNIRLESFTKGGGPFINVDNDDLALNIEDAQRVLLNTVSLIRDNLGAGNFDQALSLVDTEGFADSLELFKIINDSLDAEMEELLKLDADNKEGGVRRNNIKKLRELLNLESIGKLLDGGFQGTEGFRQAILKQIQTMKSSTLVNQNNQDKLKEFSDELKTIIDNENAFKDLNETVGGPGGTVKIMEDFNSKIKLAFSGVDLKDLTPKKKYGGGVIYGSSGVDRVPAMLTAGEFVMTKSATSKFLPALQAMNRGVPPQHFAKGGLVGSLNNPSSIDSSTSVGDINVTVNTNGNVDARALASEINRQVRSGTIRLNG